jgi:trigger factor
MNITKQNIDGLNATIKLQLVKEDYEEKVTKVLNDYRKKANIPGFRPGKVPFSMITKMYRKPVLVDEINKLVSEKLNEYLKNENIHVMGDPLPSNTENKTFDFDNDSDFEFVFDIGLAPEFEVKISEKDKITEYEIQLEDSMIENYLENYSKRFGKFIETDVVVENELVKGDLSQTDNEGQVVEGGISIENTSIYLEMIKDAEEKKLFAGTKVGDTVKFDIKKLYPTDTELAGILKIEKEKVAEINPKFQCMIKGISRFEKAELNQELFDKVYGENVVTSNEEFNKKIAEDISSSLKKDSEYKFGIDARKYFMDKLKLQLPSEFLKRWLAAINEGKITTEQIEKEFPHFEEDMKWQLIKNKIEKDNHIEVNQDEVVEFAKVVTRNQFRQYGINNVSDEHIASYSVNLLKKEEEVRKMKERLLEDKIIAFIREKVSVKSKQVTNEEFGKLFT